MRRQERGNDRTVLDAGGADRGRPNRHRSLLAPVAATACLVGGCVAHPVGPARTAAKYEGKAVTTAESALSAVESARLAADAAARNKSFGPYTASVIGDSEEALTGVQGTFGSIQPPDDVADQLRSEVDDLLSEAGSHLSDLRIAARRADRSSLTAAAAPLADDAEHLRAFVEEHS